MNKETIRRINKVKNKIAKSEAKINAYMGELCNEILNYFDFSDSLINEEQRKEYIYGISIIQTTDGLCFVDNDGLNIPVDYILKILSRKGCDKISYSDFTSCSI